MASRRRAPAVKPLAPPSPALPERVTAVLPRSFTKTTAPSRRTRRASLFRWHRSPRAAAAAAAEEEPRSPQVNCAGQVRAAARGGSPDYACFCIPASGATSKEPFRWRRLFPFLRDRRRQVSEETTTTTAAAAIVVGDERARYLVRPPGKASMSSPPANALVLMRCRSVDPNSKLQRAMDSRRVWEGSRVVLDMKEATTSQMQDACGNQEYGPACSTSLRMGSEEEVDEEEVTAPEKKVEELNGL